jgi:putative DNA primase/helicase
MPGVFNWAVQGLARLRRQGRFTESSVCQEAIDQYRSECNPARSFLEEACVESAPRQVPTATLYAHYRQWCERNNYHSLGERGFGKEVVRVFPKTRRARPQVDRQRYYVYEGIEFRGVLSHDLWL